MLTLRWLRYAITLMFSLLMPLPPLPVSPALLILFYYAKALPLFSRIDYAFLRYSMFRLRHTLLLLTLSYFARCRYFHYYA